MVNWNTCELLRACLRSVGETLGAVSHEVLVCDNASADGSAEMVEAEFPEVRLVRNGENVGFARANNQLIELSRGEYVLLLNSDAQLREGTVQGLREFMDRHPRAGACSPQLRNEGGRIQAQGQQFPSLKRILTRCVRADFPPLGPYLVRSQKEAVRPPCDATEMEIVSAACLLLRRRALDEVGLLNRALFFFGEEADLCYRLRAGGWQVWCEPGVEALHLVGRSSRKNEDLDGGWQLVFGHVSFIRRFQGKLPAVAVCPVIGGFYLWSLAAYACRAVLLPWREGSLGLMKLYAVRLYRLGQTAISLAMSNEPDGSYRGT
ncbi:MAG: glycosyltransferase family 2 protein [Planctomycetaceae bacterium]